MAIDGVIKEVNGIHEKAGAQVSMEAFRGYMLYKVEEDRQTKHEMLGRFDRLEERISKVDERIMASMEKHISDALEKEKQINNRLKPLEDARAQAVILGTLAALIVSAFFGLLFSYLKP